MTEVLFLTKLKDEDESVSMANELHIFRAVRQQEAIRILEKNSIDVVVVDLEGLEQEGIDFVSYLRKVHRYLLLPVIVLAADDTYESLAFHALHCFDYVIKPIRHEKMMQLFYLIGGHFDLHSKEKGLMIRTRTGIQWFEAKEILYLEICNKMLLVHARYGVFQFPYRQLSMCMEQCGGDLVQCHRAIAVNSCYVEKIDYEKRQVCLSHKYGSVALGRKYMKGLRKRFDEMPRISYTESVL